jgi:hypothetical protein
MQLQTPTWVIGDGALHSLSEIPGAPTACKWFQLVGDTITGIGRLGGPNIGATAGIPVTAGTGQFNPPIASEYDFYDLTAIYYTLAIGDRAVFACAT